MPFVGRFRYRVKCGAYINLTSKRFSRGAILRFPVFRGQGKVHKGARVGVRITGRIIFGPSGELKPGEQVLAKVVFI